MRINIFSILTFFCAIILIGISGPQASAQDVNLALAANNPKVRAAQSSVYLLNGFEGGPAKNAVDGVTAGDFWAKNTVLTIDTDGWFEVDLGDFYKISKIVVHPATGTCCLENFKPILIVTDYPINPPGTDESKRLTSSDVINENPFGVPMTNDEKIKASSNFFKYFETAVTRPETVEVNKTGRYVRLQMNGFGGNTRVALAELEIFGNKTAEAGYKPDKTAWNDPTNLTRNPAVGATIKQSSTNGAGRDGAAENAIDGRIKGGIVNTAETRWSVDDSWIEVDLGKSYKINKIAFYPRSDCCSEMFKSTYLIITNEKIGDIPMLDDARIGNSSTSFKSFEPMFMTGEKQKKVIDIDGGGAVGRYVRLQVKGWGAVELSEIEIYGDPTPIAYTQNPAKKWDAELKIPFDPDKPYFLGIDPMKNGVFRNTLQSSPKIVVAKNSATSFDIAYQDLYGDGKTIRINTYDKSESGANFVKNATKSMNLPGTGADGQPLSLGVFAGFTKDANGNRYVFTGMPWTNVSQPAAAQVIKIAPVQNTPEVIWTAKYFKYGDQGLTEGAAGLMNGFTTGTSRLVAAENSLLITTNIDPAHPYQVILNTQDKSENKNRAFFESLNQHNFGQRAIFDGKDFVIMENRDHDVSVSLSKLKPNEVLPLIDETLTAEQAAKLTDQQKREGHSGAFTKRIFSVYSHTNFGNHTYTELGNVEKGFDDNGYLVLFASEPDWSYKMTDNYAATNIDNKTNQAPKILNPRDIGLVHVKKDFNTVTKDVNWLSSKGDTRSMCPAKVDNSSYVNSTGTTETVKYNFLDDGWNWEIYNCLKPSEPCFCRDENKINKLTERTLVTKGVKWLTTFGKADKANSTKKTTGDFTSVNHPKLVRIEKNKYVVLWEEWKADSAGYGNPEKQYLTTKAALITLEAAPDGEVNIKLNSDPKDLGKVRLMPGDDAFEFDGKAAWAVGDVTKGKLKFYTVDAALNLASYELEL